MTSLAHYEPLARLARAMAHEARNPLNAMVIHLSLLADKVEAVGEAAAGCSRHVAALKEQAGRVNEVIRRCVEVFHPPTSSAGMDVGAVLLDATALFAYEANRRRLTLVCHAERGLAFAEGDSHLASAAIVGSMVRGIDEAEEGSTVTVALTIGEDELEVGLEIGGRMTHTLRLPRKHG